MASYKILLADDSVTTRKVVELTFADEGFEVVSVADGDEAMKKFVEIEPDIVIVDVNMPGMSGYEICEMIKADENTRNIPVILLVGSFEPFDPGEASRVGANYYFTKPFRSIRELIEKVTEYLELGAASEPIEPETADIEGLYNESFQTTLEMPWPDKAEEAAVLDAVGYVTEDDHEIDNAVPEGHSYVIEEGQEEIEAELAADAQAFAHKSGRKKDRNRSAASSPLEAEVLTPVDERKPHHVSVSQELGDAGMDDEIIETSHPGEPVLAGTREVAANPFDERVDESDTATEIEEVDKDASMAKFDWSGESAGVSEEVAQPERSTLPLKFTLEDVEPAAVAAAEEVHFAQREEPDAGRSTISRSNVSPELIEMIVSSVLEKMSDRAVRDIAQESVPRIAEKLIREALDDENNH